MLVTISETKHLLSAIIIINFKLILIFTFFYLNFLPYDNYINNFNFYIFPIMISEELNKDDIILKDTHFYE